jgi:hypothetical protein
MAVPGKEHKDHIRLSARLYWNVMGVPWKKRKDHSRQWTGVE